MSLFELPIFQVFLLLIWYLLCRTWTVFLEFVQLCGSLRLDESQEVDEELKPFACLNQELLLEFHTPRPKLHNYYYKRIFTFVSHNLPSLKIPCRKPASWAEFLLNLHLRGSVSIHEHACRVSCPRSHACAVTNNNVTKASRRHLQPAGVWL